MADPLSMQPVGDAPADEVVLMVVTRWSGSSWVARIKRAYTTYPWISEQGTLFGLTQRSSLFYKGTLIEVPADAEVHAAKLTRHFCVR